MTGEGGRGERPRASALLLTKGPVTTRTYNPEIDPAKISVIKELMWTQDRTHSTARSAAPPSSRSDTSGEWAFNYLNHRFEACLSMAAPQRML